VTSAAAATASPPRISTRTTGSAGSAASVRRAGGVAARGATRGSTSPPPQTPRDRPPPPGPGRTSHARSRLAPGSRWCSSGDITTASALASSRSSSPASPRRQVSRSTPRLGLSELQHLGDRGRRRSPARRDAARRWRSPGCRFPHRCRRTGGRLRARRGRVPAGAFVVLDGDQAAQEEAARSTDRFVAPARTACRSRRERSARSSRATSHRPTCRPRCAHRTCSGTPSGPRSPGAKASTSSPSLAGHADVRTSKRYVTVTTALTQHAVDHAFGTGTSGVAGAENPSLQREMTPPAETSLRANFAPGGKAVPQGAIAAAARTAPAASTAWAGEQERCSHASRSPRSPRSSASARLEASPIGNASTVRHQGRGGSVPDLRAGTIASESRPSVSAPSMSPKSRSAMS